MAIQVIGGVSGSVMEVGAAAQIAGHVTVKPVPYGTLGHYRVVSRFTLAATQAANARLFEIQNNGTNLIIPTRCIVTAFQTAAGTAQVGGLDFFKATAFTAVDTTNTVTPTASRKKTTMGAAPGNLNIRNVTVAGAAAGMTGGTLTKDGGPFWSLSYAVAAAAATSNTSQWGPYDIFDDVNGTHPFALAQNEGLELENRTLNTTSFGVEVTVNFSWAEVTAY